ncbi:uncharacterized protein LOC131611912 [Vicia villosa]|uniref:uncharacterized protein LOC131611912 n=1 Tax=Vicia villosa TaxID=3911 RepID=UPI00273A9703|nr:uncharacterized protein LOC131611912 [Vicia villosa]
MPWKDDIYSQVKGPEKRGHVRCIGNIPKPKKSKAFLSENQELRDELKKMRESQERTNVFMENMMSVIQNRLSQEDLNVILQAARQATDASSAPNQTNSKSPCPDDDEREED